MTGVIDGVAFEGDQYYDHGWEHAGMCASKADSASCWYNVDTFNLSEDGGNHFARPKPPRNYFISLPYKYQVNRGPEGYSVDANIVKVGEWYYDTNPIRTAVGALAAIEEGRS